MSHQYNNQSMPIHPQDQQRLSHSMQPPSSPIPIDPALALYPSSYYPYHTQQQVSQQLSLVPGLSSPSSQASDTMSTPPTEQVSFPGSNKRPSSSALDNDNDSKRRKEEDGASPSVDGSEPKAKPTRGSRSVQIILIPRVLTRNL
jgi:hypothetical protein